MNIRSYVANEQRQTIYTHDNIHTNTEMAKDAGLPEISGKFQICPVNPSSLPDNLSNNVRKQNNVNLPVYKKYLTKSHLIVNNHCK